MKEVIAWLEMFVVVQFEVVWHFGGWVKLEQVEQWDKMSNMVP